MNNTLKTNMADLAAPNDADEPQQHGETMVSQASFSSNKHNNNNGPSSDKATIAKLSAQLKRLNDANSKYKNLLKLAKERIEKQEEETSTIREEHAQISEQLLELEEKEALWTLNASTTTKDNTGNSSTVDELGDSRNAKIQQSSGEESSIVRICQRTQDRLSDGSLEVWALVEMQSTSDDGSISRRYKEWKRFDTEAQLQDYIRLDTGEPIVLPPYALSQEQSKLIQEQVEQQIVKVNDEFRRFRVKSELARKQSESLIRELQTSLTQKVAQRIENGNGDSNLYPSTNSNMSESEQVRSLAKQLERVKMELATKGSQWKQSYEAVRAENAMLQSSGSEALLAAQWRQRYEQCMKEKEGLESRMKLVASPNSTDNEYEAKYKDLKESFRLYRKKAKEIFEAQQLSTGGGVSSSIAMGITSNSSADAKLSYLKNLMMNYFTSDPSVRDHMLTAIGTVLQFTPEEQKRIVTTKATQESWF